MKLGTMCARYMLNNLIMKIDTYQPASAFYARNWFSISEQMFVGME